MSKGNFQPTQAQKQVIEATDPLFTVQAAAGSGKTSVLVAKYLRHVREGTPPDQILTITFTKKAAAEMKMRIVSALRDGGFSNEAQIAETGPIQTIHSFCERMLRENSLEAGVDPEFEILGESDFSTLRERCLREAIVQCSAESGMVAEFVREFTGKQGFNSSSPAYGQIADMVQNVLGAIRGSTRSLGEFDLDYSSVESVKATAYKALSRWMQSKYGELPGLEIQPNPKEFVERAVVALRSEGKPVPSWLKGNDAAEESGAIQTYCLMQISITAWLLMEREMASRQEFDFVLLEQKAVQLLINSQEARSRVTGQFQVVLIDESQDVNPMQFQLIELLGPNHMMLVGDPQQSIYRFRFADRDLFIRKSSQNRTLELVVNHRSEKGILRFVDYLFGRLWAGDYRPMKHPSDQPSDFGLDESESRDFTGVEVWRAGDYYADSVAEGISQLVQEGEPLRNMAVLLPTFKKIQEVAISLQSRGIPFQIVGGAHRFYSRLEVRDIANALQVLVDPFDDFALLCVLRSPLVGLSFDSIVRLSLTQPVYENLTREDLPDEEDREKARTFLNWFEQARQNVDRRPAWEVLTTILSSSNTFAELAKRPGALQMIANVRKLIRFAADSPEQGPREFADRIREIQSIEHKEGDAPTHDESEDLVTLMTIHKSKGLEYPTVIVPVDSISKRKSKRVWVNSSLGVVSVSVGTGGDSLVHRWLGSIEADEASAEAERVWYVAMTRAQKRLCLCVDRKARGLVIHDAVFPKYGDLPGIKYRLRD